MTPYISRMRQATAALGVLLAAIACPPLARAQAASPPSYFDILDRYRAGQFGPALISLSGLAPRDLVLGLKALDRSSVDRMRTSIALHTEAAIVARALGDVSGWKQNHGIAEGLVMELEDMEAQASFPRTWRLLVIGVLEAQGDLRAAVDAGAVARKRGGDTAELLLAIGAAQEIGWTWRHHDDRDAPLGSLDRAEDLYRAALALDGTLLEARVRLGRVLTLGARIDAGLETLGSIRETREAGFLYLARLFEGDAFERRGDVEAAERAYAAAARAMPHAQSAPIAAAHLRHALGYRIEAAESIQVTARPGEADTAADPWHWYSRGTAWRVEGYLASLRAAVVTR